MKDYIQQAFSKIKNNDYIDTLGSALQQIDDLTKELNNSRENIINDWTNSIIKSIKKEFPMFDIIGNFNDSVIYVKLDTQLHYYNYGYRSVVAVLTLYEQSKQPTKSYYVAASKIFSKPKLTATFPVDFDNKYTHNFTDISKLRKAIKYEEFVKGFGNTKRWHVRRKINKEIIARLEYNKKYLDEHKETYKICLAEYKKYCDDVNRLFRYFKEQGYKISH